MARLKDGEFPLIMEVIICWEIFRHCQNPPKKQYNTIHSRGLLPPAYDARRRVCLIQKKTYLIIGESEVLGCRDDARVESGGSEDNALISGRLLRCKVPIIVQMAWYACRTQVAAS